MKSDEIKVTIVRVHSKLFLIAASIKGLGQLNKYLFAWNYISWKTHENTNVTRGGLMMDELNGM